jgi:hypothetical protein
MQRNIGNFELACREAAVINKRKLNNGTFRRLRAIATRTIM